ncbi:hypothetical protein ACHAPA_008989 [Fusarium lateritium]
MSEPPQLFAWSVDEHYKFTHLDTVNISKSAKKTPQHNDRPRWILDRLSTNSYACRHPSSTSLLLSFPFSEPKTGPGEGIAQVRQLNFTDIGIGVTDLVVPIDHVQVYLAIPKVGVLNGLDVGERLGDELLSVYEKLSLG